LTEDDKDKMVPKGFAGHICVNSSAIPKKFPHEFYFDLNILCCTLSRKMKADCRPIISYFLAFAVDNVRELFNYKWLVIHSEISIPSVQIPEVELVGGTLHFMITEIVGDTPMGNTLIYWRLTLEEDVMITSNEQWAKANAMKPVFIIIEAKRSHIVIESSSEAELIG